MDTAVKLNQLVKDRSSGTQLLVINLPGAPAEENDWLHCILFNPLGGWVGCEMFSGWMCDIWVNDIIATSRSLRLLLKTRLNQNGSLGLCSFCRQFIYSELRTAHAHIPRGVLQIM